MAHAAGADGFVNKGSSLAELVQAIEQVLDGEISFPRRRAGRRGADGGRRAAHPKELEVLGLLSQGLSNLQIADRLHISNKTVSTHKKKHPAQNRRRQPAGTGGGV
ncbi:LuxR C-terminal-related transcriptional regulator [Serratia ureilytica]